MFSYKAQVDDTMEDDNVSLPHQQSFSSLKTDSDYIYQVSIIYNKNIIYYTHFMFAQKSFNVKKNTCTRKLNNDQNNIFFWYTSAESLWFLGLVNKTKGTCIFLLMSVCPPIPLRPTGTV